MLKIGYNTIEHDKTEFYKKRLHGDGRRKREKIMASGLPTALRHLREKQTPLRFGAGGKFRILHLTDIHEVPLPETDREGENYTVERRKSIQSMNVINRCIELAKPELVVFGGDNISGFPKNCTYGEMRSTIKRIVKPVADKNIPLAVIFGNHDSEMSDIHPYTQREIQLCIFAEYDNCRSTLNDEDIFGCASCALPVLHSRSDKIAWNLWCLDSNDYIRAADYSRPEDLGYDYVHSDQLEWRERTAERLKKENGGKTVPSIVFQHIPLLQIYDLFAPAEADDPNAFEKNGKYYKVPDDAFVSGKLREAPCPTSERRDEFESWKKTGDIVGAFFGHDHPNDFIAEIDGIKLVQTPGVRYYANAGTQGGRLIVLDENNPTDFYTEVYQIPRLPE